MESGPDLIRALTWVGGAAISLLSIFGAGGIILAFLKRYWDKGDRNRDLTDAANVERVKGENALAASTLEYFKAELRRVSEKSDLISERVKTLEGELVSQREMNARKDEQIKNLQKENELLRQRAREQDKALMAQEIQITEQKSQIQELCLELDRLKQQVEQFGNK